MKDFSLFLLEISTKIQTEFAVAILKTASLQHGDPSNKALPALLVPDKL